jgi:hypothetical protein
MYRFSGHETFPFRYTWLPKGVQGVMQNPSLFFEEEAMVKLGVGKNMVKSIRHWCETLSLIEFPERAQRAYPTQLGAALFGFDRWDPYLEDPATLWLLHWLLVSRQERASTWHLAFTSFNVDLFDSRNLVDWLMKIIALNPNVRATPASVKRDVEVFLRTYTPSRTTKPGPLSEDTFDCPLVELGLLREVEHGIYQFVRGPKPSLPDVIFVYALMDFWEQTASQQQALTFEQILHGHGSPGAAFKISENALTERLERLPRWSNLIYNDTAGRRQVFKHGIHSDGTRFAILSHHYGAIPAGL